MKHLFFFGDGLVGVASEDDALDGDAGKSERGVAWTSPPIANTTDREREGGGGECQITRDMCLANSVLRKRWGSIRTATDFKD